jgi:hypothetical protein
MIGEGIDNAGYYEFTVPGPLSDYCKVKISELNGTTYDISNNVFQITALNIVYPGNGDMMVYDTQDSIKWVDCGGIDKVNIELSRDGGQTWELLASDVDNTGYYEFTVPGPPSDRCKIKISSLDGVVYNTSDLFSIVDSSVNWLTPGSNSGTIAGGQSENITLTISSEGLSEGIYDAFLKITTNLGQIVNIPVHLEVTSEGVDSNQHLSVPRLYQNYPNPFSPRFNRESTKISFNLATDLHGLARIKIYNIKGQKIRTFSNLQINKSPNQLVVWDGKDENGKPVGSGIYFYRLKVGDKIIDTKKCLILR